MMTDDDVMIADSKKRMATGNGDESAAAATPTSSESTSKTNAALKAAFVPDQSEAIPKMTNADLDEFWMAFLWSFNLVGLSVALYQALDIARLWVSVLQNAAKYYISIPGYFALFVVAFFQVLTMVYQWKAKASTALWRATFIAQLIRFLLTAGALLCWILLDVDQSTYFVPFETTYQKALYSVICGALVAWVWWFPPTRIIHAQFFPLLTAMGKETGTAGEKAPVLNGMELHAQSV